MHRTILALSAFLFCIPSGIVEAQSKSFGWPQFRGPGGTGRALDQRIPTEFGPGVNELWSTTIPQGTSSPVVWNESIFITGNSGDKVSVNCYSLNNGELQWSQSYALKYQEDYLHVDCSPASPTCCCDERHVYSYFGAVGLLAHDFSGNLVWKKEFSDVPTDFGVTTSPIVFRDKLFLVRDVPTLSAVYCFDKATGQEQWMTPRLGRAGSFSTPIIWNHKFGSELVVAGSGHLDSYSIDRGELIWTISNLPQVVCPSPSASYESLVYGAWTTAHASGSERLASVLDEHVILTQEQMKDPAAFLEHFDANNDKLISPQELPESRLRDVFRFVDGDKNGTWSLDEIQTTFTTATAPGRNVMIAVKPGGKGDITNSHVMWTTNHKLPYVASPLIDNGRVYYVKKGGFLTCLDLSSGDLVFQARLGLGGEYYASPIRIGDHILIAAERGKVFVLRLGSELDIVGEADFGAEGILATPAVADNKLIVRTTERLYLFGATE